MLVVIFVPFDDQLKVRFGYEDGWKVYMKIQDSSLSKKLAYSKVGHNNEIRYYNH